MQICAEQLGKRFNRHWVFRKVNVQFSSGQPTAITGPNGSGKSTLLQVIAGATEKSEGQIRFLHQKQEIANENHFSLLAVAAPYLELIEELTLMEMMAFHFRFKPLLTSHSFSTIIAEIGLTDAQNRTINQYSSGMKQRVKLALSIFSEVPAILLDEPTSNLDSQGIALYHHLVQHYCMNRLLIVCSNDPQEIEFCTQRLDVSDYKTVFQ